MFPLTSLPHSTPCSCIVFILRLYSRLLLPVSIFSLLLWTLSASHLHDTTDQLVSCHPSCCHLLVLLPVICNTRCLVISPRSLDYLIPPSCSTDFLPIFLSSAAHSLREGGNFRPKLCCNPPPTVIFMTFFSRPTPIGGP